ncbi:hypothetical protein KW785_03625, partial [Candidatus Parcubacteria bacterium]|nr:hypothetical protein [Candidatus Parcubacteria bacterium]
ADKDKLEVEVAKIANTEVRVELKANEKNHLFAALTREKISGLLKEKGIEISSGLIDIEAPIKEVGTFSIPVSVGEKQTHFTLVVEAR